jgi:hypothetical protein
MKHTKNKLPKIKIKELAEQFSHQLDAKLPISVMPNGDIVYKQYLVRHLPSGNWGLYDINCKDLKDQFYLKTCALMAAKAYNNVQLEKYYEIKDVDNKYWASYSNLQIYKNNIKTAKDFDRYVILLNKLEESEARANHFKEQISRMFSWSFV